MRDRKSVHGWSTSLRQTSQAEEESVNNRILGEGLALTHHPRTEALRVIHSTSTSPSGNRALGFSDVKCPMWSGVAVA